jgi:hypothetical protein
MRNDWRGCFLDGEPRSSGKEILKRPVAVGQRLLEHLAITCAQPGRFGLMLELGQLSRERMALQRFAGLSVVVAPRRQGPVVDKATSAGHPRKNLMLFRRGFQPKTKGFSLKRHASKARPGVKPCQSVSRPWRDIQFIPRLKSWAFSKEIP